jgi:hypothetical protein
MTGSTRPATSKSCFGWLVFWTFAVMVGCRSIPADWNGTWRLNRSKSNFQGPTFSVSISANGDYRYDDGRSTFSFRCDDIDRAIGKNSTQACVKSSATALDLIRKENGVRTRSYHWELFAGGKEFRSTMITVGPKGPVSTTQIFATRISGSNDFAGLWRDTSYLRRHSDMTITLDKQTLHLGYPNAGQYIDARLNGIDTPVHGPHAPEGLTYTVRISRGKFLILTKRNGEVLTQGSLALSSDGNVITDSWWSPNHPTPRATIVYERQ